MSKRIHQSSAIVGQEDMKLIDLNIADPKLGGVLA